MRTWIVICEISTYKQKMPTDFINNNTYFKWQEYSKGIWLFFSRSLKQKKNPKSY